MHVSALYVYPVKGLRGTSVSAVGVDALGIVGDRRFLVIDDTGRFLTQRVLPRMALVDTALEADALVLSTAGTTPLRVPLQEPSAVVRPVTVWKSEGLLAEDCGPDAAAWLSRQFGSACRLVRIGPQFRRPMTKAVAAPGDLVAFTDAFPFMVVGEASLADLNDRLLAQGEEPMPMNRFRPSFVVSGCPPYGEDTWGRIKVGDVILRAGGACVRCLVTTTDQTTAERGKEPLRLLSTYRRDPGDSTGVIFGQNFIHETKHGGIRLNDVVEVLPPA